MEIPAPEVIRYAELHPACAGGGTLLPCAENGSGAADARAALDAYNSRHPATKFALANLEGTLMGLAAKTGPGQDVCPACGEFLEGGVCPACTVRQKYAVRSLP